ncbi:RnfH family protein [soil metagenome]
MARVPDPASLSIEVAYARPERQLLVQLHVPRGTTAIDAVRCSGILQQAGELDAARLDLGVYGVPVDHGHRLAGGDRVEIYRPLKLDPREARRRRAGLSATGRGERRRG